MSFKLDTSHKVLFLGDDSSHYQELRKRIINVNENLSWSFDEIFVGSNESNSSENVLIKIVNSNYKIIYIDFSKSQSGIYNLLDHLIDEPILHDVSIVGLVGSKRDLNISITRGVNLVYVKGGEFYDMVYGPMVKAFPTMIKRANFATGSLEQKLKIICDFQIIYIAPTYMHVEGDFELDENGMVSFENQLSKTNVPSSNFIAKNKSDQKLIYNYNFAYDFEFEFVAPPDIEKDQGMILRETNPVKREKLMKEIVQKRAHLRADHEAFKKKVIKKHKDWLEDKLDIKGEKQTKIMIVDQKFRLFQEKSFSELKSTPFIFKFQTRFFKDFLNIKKYRPNIIVLQVLSQYTNDERKLLDKARFRLKNPDSNYETEPDMATERKILKLVENLPNLEKQEMSRIQQLIETIKSQNSYSPIVIIFGCTFTDVRALQETLQYPTLTAYSQNMNAEILFKMTELYENKQNERKEKMAKAMLAQMKVRDPKKYGKLNISDYAEKKYFIKATDPMGQGPIELDIELSSINESEVLIKSKYLLSLKTFRLNEPVPMYINLIPQENGNDFDIVQGKNLYRGLIHGVSENDKKQLRIKVNELFFDPLEEERKKELKEFEELNKKKSQSK